MGSGRMGRPGFLVCIAITLAVSLPILGVGVLMSLGPVKQLATGHGQPYSATFSSPIGTW